MRSMGADLRGRGSRRGGGKGGPGSEGAKCGAGSWTVPASTEANMLVSPRIGYGGAPSEASL